ncbi:hypothetical protein [Flavobacterium sp. B183]|uniref:hypothetical protein n=1 Tax=Flavobacterium sp. B183 TaxID=907046 RepID=UPI00201FA21B|nr:hypothetical protein [Flavobacterium sp. B183]URC13950.1 hypothetical protein M4I44_06010 [Flavobacterium sp. B183]URC14030.1 hypothetical protein M4I44_06475 [Flavobacterium sp. B183]
MAKLVDGLWLEQYVEPQLLEEFRNYKDDFIGTFKAPSADALDKDGIKFNKLINEIKFHVNKTTEFEPVDIPNKKGLIEWDKLDTDLTIVTDKSLRAMAFDRESELRRLHNEAFRMGVRDYALRKIAPKENTSKTPILRTTGEDDGTGRKKMKYSDMIKYYSLAEGLNFTDWAQVFMILCAEHRQDLIEDRGSTNNIRDIEIDPVTGELKRFFKLKFFENNSSVKFNGNDKPVLSGVNENTDRNGSLLYYAPNIVHHIEAVKVLYKPMIQDTRNPDPQSEIRLHCYGLTDKKQEYGAGAIVSGIVE